MAPTCTAPTLLWPAHIKTSPSSRSSSVSAWEALAVEVSVREKGEAEAGAAGRRSSHSAPPPGVDV